MTRKLVAVALGLALLGLLPSPAEAATTDVAIQDNFFTPNPVTVTAGTDVKWTHMGSFGHTVTADDGSFDSNPTGSMTNGQTFTVTFSGPARTVRYYCKIHGGPNGVGMSGSVVVQAAVSPKPPANFDGDTDTDIAVFRPSGTWFTKDGLALGYGAQGDIPVPATYDADGKTDVAIYRPNTGLWSIRNSTNGTDTGVTYGISTDTPVPADYDGDGKADIAVYRPSTGAWYVHQSSTNTDVITTFGGINGDIPIVGDYDADGKADRAIYRGGVWYVHPSSGGADTATNYGVAGDIPIPGTYDADAKTDMAIFRPSTGLWSIRNSTNGTDTGVTYGGVPGDEPVPGDFDGDGKTDIAILRPQYATWFVHQSSTGTDNILTFGVPGDVPLPLPAAIRRVFF